MENSQCFPAFLCSIFEFFLSLSLCSKAIPFLHCISSLYPVETIPLAVLFPDIHSCAEPKGQPDLNIYANLKYKHHRHPGSQKTAKNAITWHPNWHARYTGCRSKMRASLPAISISPPNSYCMYHMIVTGHYRLSGLPAAR